MLRAAVYDLAWLRTRGYGDPSSVKMVGDRYQLTRRQRNAVARSACSDAERAHRRVRRKEPRALEGHWVNIDGFNVLISIEGLLGGAYLFVGRDRAYRDVDPVQGTYRIVAETKPAIRLIRETLKALRVVGVTWWLDAHVHWWLDAHVQMWAVSRRNCRPSPRRRSAGRFRSAITWTTLSSAATPSSRQATLMC